MAGQVIRPRVEQSVDVCGEIRVNQIVSGVLSAARGMCARDSTISAYTWEASDSGDAAGLRPLHPHAGAGPRQCGGEVLSPQRDTRCTNAAVKGPVTLNTLRSRVGGRMLGSPH